MTWQAARAKTRQPYLPKLVVLVGTPCHFCTHVRSSHSTLTLQAPCRVSGCDCPVFDPMCGCGHILSEHTWGTPPQPWGCAFCPCSLFGADITGTVERKERTEVFLPPLPAEPSLPRPGPEVHRGQGRHGEIAWGRLSLGLYECTAKACRRKATHWTTTFWLGLNGKPGKTEMAYCEPCFRQWSAMYGPLPQPTLF